MMRRATNAFNRASAWLLIAAVRIYQITLGPFLGGARRFKPTSSEYFIEAVQVHGPGRGTLLGLKRLLRCRPGGGSGYDPVPPVRTEERSAESGASAKPSGTAAPAGEVKQS